MSLGPEAQWRTALADGQFLLQRATATGAFVFPPRVMEPRSGDQDLEWVPASGMGHVHSVTIVHPRPPAEPYNVVLVDLDEGPRLMSRVEGTPPDAVTIGLRVRARVGQIDGAPAILFDPA